MKIAIIKLSALGDIIQAAFVLQFIKQKLPSCTIDWIVEEKFAQILEGTVGLDNIKQINLSSVKENPFLLISQIQKIRSFGSYDIIIDMQGLLKSAIVAKLLGKHRAGFSKNGTREPIASIFYTKRIDLGYRMHTSDKYRLLCAEALEISITKEAVFHKRPYMYKKNTSKHLPDNQYAVFIIGSTWPSRCYPKESFLEVAQQLNMDIFIPYASDTEYAFANYLSKKCIKCHVLPKMNLSELKATLANADLVIGNDTGPTYLGWANNIKTVILFGPTPPIRVYEDTNTVLLKSPSKVDPINLDKNDFSIQKIKPEQILQSVKKLQSGMKQ